MRWLVPKRGFLCKLNPNGKGVVRICCWSDINVIFKKWISTWHSVQVKVLSVVHVAWKELWVSHRKKVGALLVFPDRPKTNILFSFCFCVIFLNSKYTITSCHNDSCSILFPSRSRYDICLTAANMSMLKLFAARLEISLESLCCIDLLPPLDDSHSNPNLIPSSDIEGSKKNWPRNISCYEKLILGTKRPQTKKKLH